MTTEQKEQFIIEKCIEANPSIKDRNSRTLENGMVETCFCVPKITLEDILMAMAKAKKDMVVSPSFQKEGIGCIVPAPGFKAPEPTFCYWYFGKPLTEQSEELKNFVYELLKDE